MRVLACLAILFLGCADQRGTAAISGDFATTSSTTTSSTTSSTTSTTPSTSTTSTPSTGFTADKVPTLRGCRPQCFPLLGLPNDHSERRATETVAILHHEETSTTTTTTLPVHQERGPTLTELIEVHFLPADWAWAHRVAMCESSATGRETFSSAVNSSSGSTGWFQHLPKFWQERSVAAGVPDASMFDPVANVIVAAYLLYETPQGRGHWYPSAHCWTD